MSFQAALSGLNAASQDLNVAGNNIANAGTTGFKGSRAEFADVYPASALGTAGNAAGTGVRLAAITQQFTQGTINFTNNSLDLAISGNGFFQLNDNGTKLYTRAGAFNVDKNGFVSDANGRHIVGALADAQGNITGASGDLHINVANLNPKGTSAVSLTANLDAGEVPPPVAWVGSPTFGSTAPATNTYNQATSTTIFDGLGNPHVLTMFFIKSATVNRWDVRAQVDGVDVDASPTATPFTQNFSTNGNLNTGTSEAINISWTPLSATGVANGAAAPQVFSINMQTTTQFGSPFAVQALGQDGFTAGRLNNISIGTDGVIFGRYTNGQSLALGQVTLANFGNPQGLQPQGNTAWSESFVSGPPLVGNPGTASLGVVQSGALEESNVQLTNELVKLITAQRNFQANATSIRTENTVTQDIINIR